MQRIDDSHEQAGGHIAQPGTLDRYRELFDTMDEGFCIIEFFDGPHGPLSDYIHIEANPAYETNAGIANVVGQKLREMVPDEADGWVELYGSVLRTGKSPAMPKTPCSTTAISNAAWKC